MGGVYTVASCCLLRHTRSYGGPYWSQSFDFPKHISKGSWCSLYRAKLSSPSRSGYNLSGTPYLSTTFWSRSSATVLVNSLKSTTTDTSLISLWALSLVPFSKKRSQLLHHFPISRRQLTQQYLPRTLNSFCFSCSRTFGTHVFDKILKRLSIRTLSFPSN